MTYENTPTASCPPPSHASPNDVTLDFIDATNEYDSYVVKHVSPAQR